MLGFYAEHAPPDQALFALRLIRERYKKHIEFSNEKIESSALRRIFRKTKVRREKHALTQDTQHLKDAYQEYYRLLDMLASFRELNHLAFAKALKKHDKVSGLKMQRTFIKQVESRETCCDSLG